MHRPGYIQGGQGANRGYLLLGVHHRRIRGFTIGIIEYKRRYQIAQITVYFVHRLINQQEKNITKRRLLLRKEQDPEPDPDPYSVRIPKNSDPSQNVKDAEHLAVYVGSR
jgi:hypothetical protein